MAKSNSYADVLRALCVTLAGGSQAHFKRRIISLEISTEHFKGQAWAKDLHDRPKKQAKDILTVKPEGSQRTKTKFLKRALIESQIEYICDKCGQEPFWLGHPMTLDIDHIDGNWLDDRIENLRFLCPNCHSQFSRNLIGSAEIAEPKKRKAFKRKIKVVRPTEKELRNLLVKHNFSRVGKMFSVSDNAIRKWCLSYGMPTKSSAYSEGVVERYTQ